MLGDGSLGEISLGEIPLAVSPPPEGACIEVCVSQPFWVDVQIVVGCVEVEVANECPC